MSTLLTFSQRLLLTIFMLAGLTQCGWWNYEWREEYIYHSRYSGKASYNQLYAAELLLKRLQIEVNSSRHLPDLATLSPYSALLLSTPSYTLSQQQADQLLAWVADGGQLIFAAQAPLSTKKYDYLLRSLDIQIIERSGIGRVTVHLPRQASLQAHFRGNTSLQAKADGVAWVVKQNQKTVLLDLPMGTGNIIVLSDLSLFSNHYIADHDHADILWAILNWHGRPEQVWLQFLPKPPSLLELIWQRGWMVVLALLLTLISLLWTAGLRFGPQLKPLDSQQRSLLEHIAASGRFLWRQGDVKALLNTTRQHSLRRLRQPQTEPAETLAAIIAARSGIDQQQIKAALSNNNPQTFLPTIKSLQNIEQKL